MMHDTKHILKKKKKKGTGQTTKTFLNLNFVAVMMKTGNYNKLRICHTPFNCILSKLHVIFKMYHVCEVGSLPLVGAGVMVKRGSSSLKPPGGNWEQPVTNCSSLAISSCVKLLTAVQNQDRTSWNLVFCLLPWFITQFSLRSSKLTLSMPHIKS